MKTIFFIVLFINIVFFVWESNSVSNPAEHLSSETESSQYKQIMLLSEVHNNMDNLPTTQQDVQAIAVESSKPLKSVEPIVVEVALKEGQKTTNNQVLSNDILTEDNLQSGDLLKSKSIEYCFTFGPFNDQESIEDWLEKQPLELVFQEPTYIEQKLINQYMVFYPAAETIDEAEKNQQMLMEQGFTDLWLFTKGKFKGAISLGLYDRENMAMQMKDKYMQEGLTTEVGSTYKKISGWFINGLSDDENLINSYVNQVAVGRTRCLKEEQS